MSEKDRETGSDAADKASEQAPQAPAEQAPAAPAAAAPAAEGGAQEGGAHEGAGAKEAAPPASAPPKDPAPAAAPAGDPAADSAKAEARAQVIAAAKAKAEAAKAAKAAAAAAGGGEAPAEPGAAPAAKPKAEGAAKPKHGEPAGDQPPWMVDPTAPTWKDESEDPLVKALHEEHPGAVIGARSASGDLALTATREGIVAIATSLKERHGFRYIVDVAGVDFPTRPERFEVVYHVYNHATERRVRLKVSTDEATPVPSLCGVWRGVNWPEREAYDMFGIRFSDHPDLTRILLWEGFNGYPLRKEFPVEGIDTGSAIYPEYYEEGQGPISGTGTGWKPKPPPGEGDAGGAAGEKSGKPEETS